MPRSGYYRWLELQARPPKPADPEKAEREMRLVNAVLDAYTLHPAFGYRKMGYYLRNQGCEGATEKRVRLIYERLGLRGASPKFKTTRPSKVKFKKYPYLLNGMKIAYVNHVWATDITYIKLPHKMVYLTAIIDLYSRKILSWKLSDCMSVEFCLEALNEALAKYGVPAIFNTDCGSQYTSEDFTGTLEAHGIRISMDGVGRCLDNIRVERTWKTIKYEFVFLNEWTSAKQLEAGLETFISAFNKERPHEALGYQTPDQVYENGCFPVRETDTTEVA